MEKGKWKMACGENPIRFSIFLFPFSIFLLTGCSFSPYARLTVRPSNDASQAYSQTFDQVYVTRSAEGEYQAILIQDGARANLRPKPGQPLTSTPAAPVTQVFHLRVFWRPLSGTRADHPSATNAALDWYVYSNGANAGQNLLHYSGAGFVTASNARDGAKFHVRSADLILKEQRGDQMTDPIGPARITGAIVAVRDDDAVESQIARIHDLLTTGPSPRVSITNSPPARSHDQP